VDISASNGLSFTFQYSAKLSNFTN